MCPGTLHYQQPGSPQVVSSNWILMRWWDPEQPGGGKSTVTPGLLPQGRNKPLLLSTVGLVSPAEHVSLPSQDSLPAVSLPLRTGIASHAHSGLTQSAPLMQILTQIPESSTQNDTPKPCPRSSCAMKYNTLELS